MGHTKRAQIFYPIDTNFQRSCYIVRQHAANQEWSTGGKSTNAAGKVDFMSN